MLQQSINIQRRRTRLLAWSQRTSQWSANMPRLRHQSLTSTMESWWTASGDCTIGREIFKIYFYILKLIFNFFRNSPHNFKSLNTESQLFVSPVEQGRAATFKKASFVQFTVPSFTGIVTAGFETKIEVNKPETTLEKLENIFNSPPFF